MKERKTLSQLTMKASDGCRKLSQLALKAVKKVPGVVFLCVNVVLLLFAGVFRQALVKNNSTKYSQYRGVPIRNSAAIEEAFQSRQMETERYRQELDVLWIKLNSSSYSKVESSFYNADKSRLHSDIIKYADNHKRECSWIPTSHCSPYGFPDMNAITQCQVTIDDKTAGVCICADGTILSKACSYRTTNRCSDVCKTGYQYPTHRELLERFGPRPRNSKKRPKGVITTLTTPTRIHSFVRTLRRFENAFNKRYEYPYVVFFDPSDSFSNEYISTIESSISSPATFTIIPTKDWRIPSSVNLSQVTLKKHNHIPHMHSLSYRQMCRFFSGPFFNQQVLKQYDYFWRLDDDVSYLCDIYFDPFVLMKEQRKIYGYTMLQEEFMETIPTLYNVVATQINKTTDWSDLLLNSTGGYTGCHFWSNFEIGSLTWFRSPVYQQQYDILDSTGGFFYERWGDAPVHTLLLSQAVNLSSLYYFESMVYIHSSSFHTPTDLASCVTHSVPHKDALGSNNEHSKCMSRFAHLAALV